MQQNRLPPEDQRPDDDLREKYEKLIRGPGEIVGPMAVSSLFNLIIAAQEGIIVARTAEDGVKFMAWSLDPSYEEGNPKDWAIPLMMEALKQMEESTGGAEEEDGPSGSPVGDPN